ncbi:Tetratricopeptide repeat-containing protein [Streptacidiphilus jiangxiensis]|uniref:Tetratricopeptide repeat-containing protein n=2 Tax=Streptacidiphilus jiangxiensis TaxID=235985 RepID=A0A1H7NQM8_STRJI|nr:FxSxx-COOH system tetratricopeptide repeat protein [Streptacidiphilus jiangxiensis]SEL25772.1 Tetratricopeptide repeat-containing protein [Streptacidiphilus jiangxiensis]
MSTPETNPAHPRDPFSVPAIWGNVPPRNRNFAGRTRLLATLHERLQAGTTAMPPQALHGLGGIGKSQLALEYLYLHQGEYDLVWWIPAENTPQITRSLSELGHMLGLAVQSEPGTVVAAVVDALRRGSPYGRWILVFDNAESPEQIARYLPASASGAILITSRYPHWDRVARPLEVDVLPREESTELLRRRGEDLTEDEADRLAEALGDLPLAIEQVAAWRAETGMPADQYLRLFEEKQSELLTFCSPGDYGRSVATTWNVSLDQIETIDPAAIQLLQICAFYAPEPVPRHLFAGARRGPIATEMDRALADEIQLGLAMREIQRHSLARIDPRTQALQVHRLVRSVLTIRMTAVEQDRMRQGAHMLLSAADPRNPRSPTSWERYAELYPHVLASGAIESADPWVRDLVVNTATYLQRWGDHAAALEFTRKAYAAWKDQFGEEETHTLTLARRLGSVLFTTGHYAEAAELNARSLELHDRMSPHGRRPSRPSEIREEHLDAMSAVAADLRAQGEFARALQISDEVYRLSERAFDEDDPVTLNAAHNLGVSLRLVGDFEKAYELDRRTRDVKAELFGTDHEQTLLTWVGLTIDQRELGRYDHARHRQEEVVSLYRRLMGDTDPATLHARRVLAVARRKAGDHHRARKLSEQTLELTRRRFGEEHPDTLASTLAVAVDLCHTGDLDGAALLGRRTAERYRESLGPAHPHSLSAHANLAITLRLLGDPETALDLDRAAYDGLVDRLGDDHVLALACETNLGSDLSALGRHAEARDRSADARDRSARVLGPDHPSTLAATANLAIDLQALGEKEEALALHTRTMDLMRQTLGANHPVTTELGEWIRANCSIDPLPL